MKRRWLILSIGIILLSLFSTAGFGADKLLVKDSSGNTKFVVRDDGTVSLNTGAWEAPPWAQLYGMSSSNMSGFVFSSHGNSGSLGGGGLFRYSRGTPAAKSPVQSGDRIGYFVFNGYDGASYIGSAGLTAKVDNAVSPGVVPMKLVFETSRSGVPRSERLVILSNGNVGIGATAPTHLLQVGTAAYSDGLGWYPASSRQFKDNIKELSPTVALSALEGLTPVTYNYKEDKEQQRVGFIAEDVPALVALKDRTVLSPLDIVAVLTKVVQEQQQTLKEKAETVDRQQKAIEALIQKLDSLQNDVNRLKSKELTTTAIMR